MIEFTTEVVLFGFLFGVAILAFFLTAKIYKQLEISFANEYEQIGKPTLFLNNSISDTTSFLKFLYSGRWARLSAPKLAALCKGLISIHAIFGLIFLLMLFV